MNYQYRYGTSFSTASATLYTSGGLGRYYNGIGAALIQGMRCTPHKAVVKKEDVLIVVKKAPSLDSAILLPMLVFLRCCSQTRISKTCRFSSRLFSPLFGTTFPIHAGKYFSS